MSLQKRYILKTTLTKEHVIKILRKDLPFLKERYGVEKIAIFGSFAKGKQRGKSDVDILIYLKKSIGLDFIELADRLEEKLGKRVDIATFECYRKSFNKPRYKHIAEDVEKSLIYV
ncbi:MAG: nucleotidyltransferase domain-containing protein [Nitrospirae bacterium]|nr:nucleotidyltransferase domain-containing protein [Nitrospirota bacterium]